MTLLMQIALLSWVLVVGTENATNSSIREMRKIAMKESIKLSSSEKEFKTLDEMMQKMNERLENNLKRRKNALVTNRIQVFVIIGIWALLSVIWIICSVRTYLGCKRNINKVMEHYQEVTSQMLKHKKRELKNELAKKKERERRQELRQQQKKHPRKFQPVKDDTCNSIATTDEVISVEETDYANDQNSYNTSSYQSDMTMTFGNCKERHMTNFGRPRGSIKDVYRTHKPELSKEMKKFRKGFLMAESKKQSTEYDDMFKEIISEKEKEAKEELQKMNARRKTILVMPF